MLNRFLILLIFAIAVSCTSKEPPIKDRIPETVIKWFAEDISEKLGANLHSVHNEVGEEQNYYTAILDFGEKFKDFESFTNSFNSWANQYRGLDYIDRWGHGVHAVALMKLEGDPEFFISFLFPEGWQGRFVIILQSAEDLPDTNEYPTLSDS